MQNPKQTEEFITRQQMQTAVVVVRMRDDYFYAYAGGEEGEDLGAAVAHAAAAIDPAEPKGYKSALTWWERVEQRFNHGSGMRWRSKSFVDGKHLSPRTTSEMYFIDLHESTFQAFEARSGPEDAYWVPVTAEVPLDEAPEAIMYHRDRKAAGKVDRPYRAPFQGVAGAERHHPRGLGPLHVLRSDEVAANEAPLRGLVALGSREDLERLRRVAEALDIFVVEGPGGP